MNPSTATLPPLFSSSSAGLPQPDLVAAIPRLRRYARVLTGNPTRADDLVQDTLLRAWDKRRLWRAGSDLRAWLFTIMHNVHANQRALARRETGTISLDSEDEYGAAWQVAEYDNQLERIELRELVELMGRLPAEQREVLLLAAVEELRYEEIAAALAIPIGTVMSRLFRARAKLKRMAREPPPVPKAMRDRKEIEIAS
jgi:RNA polymerase sigma-70 factor (ECF subfamily)